ncbi:MULTISPECIES: FecR family protein [Niastella]|uniref:FecR family protein n=1 Tax=Niastella soli TaxID=2821487 RepID=A0ABS3YSS8_9BACT|nr:FecR family protein [Niastella soli]MBO9200972.1 FecR family protein [Niastella soli]
MQEKVNRITSLIEKFLEEKISAEEEKELNAWRAESEHNDAFFKQITDKNELREKLKHYASADSEAMWKKTVQRINSGAKLIDLYPEKKTTRLPFFKIAAAAAAILLVLAGTWYFTIQKTSNQTANTDNKNNNSNSSKKSRIVPGGNKATLTLANGETIMLNTVQNGSLADQGHMQITKTDGRLIYNRKPDSDGLNNGTDLYNTVTTPRGGQYTITLPDGSKVWLNAASSLRFPIAFAGNERIVELTGEAYFEVNPQIQPGVKQEKGKPAKTPFIVKINTPAGNRNEVEVLGTHFNVMAYTEEGAIKTTLVEGKVKVTSGNSYQTIHPGEQAKLGAGNISVQHVDAEDIIGWTNGYIPVGGHDLEYTMRQIARWYDVNIVYQGKKPEIAFEGKLPRGGSIESIIRLLNLNNIKARLNEKERTIIVTS